MLEYMFDEKRPLLNRAIQGRYPPGSTWKIPESVGALQQGTITVAHSSLACGGGLKVGNRFIRCMGNHGSPSLTPAIIHSCDGYYYRLGQKMGVNGLIKMIETFGYDKVSGIDLPNEKVPQTPKSWMPSVVKREGSWSEIRTVMAAIGQDTVVVTPISMLRAVSSVGMRGREYTPHFLKEFKQIGPVGQEGDIAYIPQRPGFQYQHPEPKLIELQSDQWDMILKGMWGVVNAGGTAGSIRMPNFEIAGKTGTAQVSQTGKDVGANKDHSWFVSFAPAYKPEISVIALIENSGFGSANAAPAVKAMYQSYLSRRQTPDSTGQEVTAK